MSKPAANLEHLQTQQDAQTTLQMLVALFPEGGDSGDGRSVFTWMRPEDVPAHASLSSLSYRESLVHEEHLTRVLQDRLAGTPRLSVLP